MNNGNPFGAAIAFWIFMQVVWSLALIGGGLYVLWCLNRIATSVERLANAREVDTLVPDAPLATPFGAQQFVPTTVAPSTEIVPPTTSPRLPDV